MPPHVPRLLFLITLAGALPAWSQTVEPQKVAGEQSGLDDLRSEVVTELLAELEARVEAGELAEARFFLWGIWAQCRRDRYWTVRRTRPRSRERADQLLAIDARYQRARDACFGSAPTLEAGDDELALASQIDAGRIGLLNGDLGTALSVAGHLKRRRSEGLVVSQELLVQAQAMVDLYREKNQRANEVLRAEGNLVITTDMFRGEKNVEERFHELFRLQERLAEVDGSQLASNPAGARIALDTGSHYLGLTADMAAAREALVAFASVSPDPEWMESAFAGFISQKPKTQGSWESFLGVIRAGCFGEAVFERLELPRRIGAVYLDYADECLKKAEKEYQKNRSDAGAAQLAQVETGGLANARQFGIAPEQVALREARMEAIKASAGASKLKQAQSCLGQAESSLEAALETPRELDRALKLLESAGGWLEGARVDGVPPGELASVETELARIQARASGKVVELAEQELSHAEETLAEARELLASGELAWQAPATLDRGEKHLLAAHAYTEAFGASVPDDTRQNHATRSATALRHATALREQVASSQTLPVDAYQGAAGAAWRQAFIDLLAQEREWEVLGLSIVSSDWKDRTASYEYLGGSNTTIIETRWYREIFVWAAIAQPAGAELIDLRYLGFRLHKMTDGSYAKLKLFWVDEPLPMLRAKLAE